MWRSYLVEADPPTWPGQSERQEKSILGVVESNRKEKKGGLKTQLAIAGFELGKKITSQELQ